MDISGVLGSLRLPAGPAPAAPALAAALATGGSLEALLEGTLPEGILLRLPDGKVLQAQGNLPFPPGSQLVLRALPLPQGAGVRLQVIQATPPPAPAILAPLLQGEAGPLLARLASDPRLAALAHLHGQLAQGGPEAPESATTWAAWLKEVVSTLANPARAPGEAAFHALQAREGTGWFEVPLPWALGQEPLRLWVEADRPATGREPAAIQRLLLSVPFSDLGEVRVGLERDTGGLRARVWMRDPGRLAEAREALEAELGSLGLPATLQVLPMPQGALPLTSLVGTPPLQVLG